jgi:hypothetical protein
MNFLSITKQEKDGWVCQPGNINVPNDPGNRHCVMVQEDIADGASVIPYVAPEPSWLDKRLANMADGGYGTTGEQFEMIGEQGMEVYQAHIAKVKTDIPKGDN